MNIRKTAYLMIILVALQSVTAMVMATPLHLADSTEYTPADQVLKNQHTVKNSQPDDGSHAGSLHDCHHNLHSQLFLTEDCSPSESAFRENLFSYYKPFSLPVITGEHYRPPTIVPFVA